MLDFFSKLVSGPNFGLHINDSALKALQLSSKAATPHIRAIQYKNIPEGIVKLGAVQREQDLSKEIQGLLSSTQPDPINSKYCHISIPENQSFEHIFYLPAKLKGSELKSHLDELISETIPLPFHEIKYDYHSSTHNDIQAVFVVAVRRIILAQYYDILKNMCDLVPITAEPESLSLLRNIPYKQDGTKAFIIIDLKDNEIIWFSFLGYDIFDSNIISKEFIIEHPQALIQDLTASMNSFQKVTGFAIDHISISGQSEEAKALYSSIKENFSTPLQVIEDYRLVPKIDNVRYSDEFKIVSGLALKGLGIDIKADLNLFSKS